MQAVILAAGMGKRLKKITADKTKCMVRVNGVTIIERMLNILDKKELSRIVIVIGYCGQNLREFVESLNIKTPVVFIENDIYDKVNNIYSLRLAGEYLCREDTLLLESDLVFEESVVDALLQDPRENLVLVDKYENWMDGTCTVLDEKDNIVDFIPGKYLEFRNKDYYYKTVNLYKFSMEFSKNTYLPFLDAYSKAMGNNEYYESVMKLIVLLETREIYAKRLDGQLWYEIDNIQDLDIAESLFKASIEEKYDAFARRYGGYWRYPHLMDFCYIVNPYFPSRKMLDEIQSNLPALISQYPSGMEINILLAVLNFDARRRYITVGNGAAELIKALLECKDFKRLGLIRPTFEEYANRFPGDVVIYDTAAMDFSYTAEDVVSYFDGENIDALVLINPDNPSGNFLSGNELNTLIDWAKAKGISLVVDESFLDFADPGEDGQTGTLIADEKLELYQKLYVVKSISKSYGVPGVRLGVLASSDTAMIEGIKKNVSIWNINSVGEFFMQILDKYKKEYADSLDKVRKCRSRLTEDLRKIKKLRVFDSQANYVMCELTGTDITSRTLAGRLLEMDFLIKDLTPKINNGRQYIRLAVKKEEENAALTEALRFILSE